MDEKLSLMAKKSSFGPFGKIEFPSKRAKKPVTARRNLEEERITNLKNMGKSHQELNIWPEYIQLAAFKGCKSIFSLLNLAFSSILC